MKAILPFFKFVVVIFVVFEVEFVIPKDFISFETFIIMFEDEKQRLEVPSIILFLNAWLLPLGWVFVFNVWKLLPAFWSKTAPESSKSILFKMNINIKFFDNEFAWNCFLLWLVLPSTFESDCPRFWFPPT